MQNCFHRFVNIVGRCCFWFGFSFLVLTPFLWWNFLTFCCFVMHFSSHVFVLCVCLAIFVQILQHIFTSRNLFTISYICIFNTMFRQLIHLSVLVKLVLAPIQMPISVIQPFSHRSDCTRDNCMPSKRFARRALILHAKWKRNLNWWVRRINSIRTKKSAFSKRKLRIGETPKQMIARTVFESFEKHFFKHSLKHSRKFFHSIPW